MDRQRRLDDPHRVWGGHPTNEAQLLFRLGMGVEPNFDDEGDESGVLAEDSVPANGRVYDVPDYYQMYLDSESGD